MRPLAGSSPRWCHGSELGGGSNIELLGPIVSGRMSIDCWITDSASSRRFILVKRRRRLPYDSPSIDRANWAGLSRISIALTWNMRDSSHRFNALSDFAKSIYELAGWMGVISRKQSLMDIHCSSVISMCICLLCQITHRHRVDLCTEQSVGELHMSRGLGLCGQRNVGNRIVSLFESWVLRRFKILSTPDQKIIKACLTEYQVYSRIKSKCTLVEFLST